MKQKIKIQQNDKVLYYGRISDMPIKEESIIKKSIELFDDDDPCIIHQSYVIKEYVDILLTLLKKHQNNTIKVANFLDIISFLNIEDVTNVIITLEE